MARRKRNPDAGNARAGRFDRLGKQTKREDKEYRTDIVGGSGRRWPGAISISGALRLNIIEIEMAPQAGKNEPDGSRS